MPGIYFQFSPPEILPLTRLPPYQGLRESEQLNDQRNNHRASQTDPCFKAPYFHVRDHSYYLS